VICCHIFIIGSLDILDPTGDSHVTKRQTTLDAVVPVEMPSTASSALTSSTTSGKLHCSKYVIFFREKIL